LWLPLFLLPAKGLARPVLLRPVCRLWFVSLVVALWIFCKEEYSTPEFGFLSEGLYFLGGGDLQASCWIAGVEIRGRFFPRLLEAPMILPRRL